MNIQELKAAAEGEGDTGRGKKLIEDLNEKKVKQKVKLEEKQKEKTHQRHPVD